MSKELAYTKGDLSMKWEVDEYGIMIYYSDLTQGKEDKEQARGNCKLFNHAGAMYELLREMLRVDNYVSLEYRERILELLKKIES